MSDPDRPDTDRFGDPSKEIDEGSLLFDPSGATDRDDDDFFDPESPGKSKAAFWAVAGLTVILVGLFLLQLTDGRNTETPPQEVVEPLVPEIPVDTTSRAALIPLPTDSVAGPIESSVRIAVRALGDGGSALGDTLIRFTVETGDGTLQSQEVRTTAEGIAVNFVRLPTRPGPTTVVASIPDSPPHETSLTAVALPGAPARLSMASGNNQEAEVGGLVPDRLFVTVLDSRGNPVPGAVVTFRVGSGEGQLAPAQTRADSLGQASAIWRLGMIEGEQTLVASVSSLDDQVTFRATATPAATLELDNSRAETEPVTVRPNRFAVGVGHACILDGSGLACRGANDRGQSSPTGSLGFVAIAAGASHTCALSSNGVASCWGANDQGQLGDGTRNDRSSPTRVRTDLRFSTLTAGEKHTCGLAGGGVPLCWGENLSGQIGDGTRNDQMVPRTVGEGLGFTEITAGSSHTCGRTASGNTFCWGANNRGQLGDGSSGLDRMAPTRLQSAVSGLVAGHEHSCGIAAGEARCWGANTFGQLGDGTTDDRSVPTAVQGLPGRPSQLAAGTVHTCARLADGRAFCWGQNFSGQLGDGTTQNRTSPVEVAGGLRFSEIHAGGAQTCGVTTDGARYCWGLNQSGQLGDGTRANRSTPTRVGG